MRRILIAFALALATAPAQACDVPVYRYALEHWNPDSYQVVILHQGQVDLPAPPAFPHVNLTVRTIDADHPADESERNLCLSKPCSDAPRVVLRLPGAADAVVWEGPWNADAAAALVDSPCRRRIADRLLAGDAVVWVLLQSGRREQDDAAAECIHRELKRPNAEGQPPLPSSLVRVSRTDPVEKLLVESLLSTEADLRGRYEPMAFPVFGRGRVLYALVGAGVNADNVRHTLDFLVGGCSCTIKRENPGVDLLLSADWSVITPTTPEEKAAPPTVASEIVPLTPLPAATSHPTGRGAASADAAPPTPETRVWQFAAVGGAAVLVVATGWFALRPGKRGIRP